MKKTSATPVSRLNEFVKSYPNFCKFLGERTQDKHALKRISKIFEEILNAEGQEESIKLSQKCIDRYLQQASKALEELCEALDITMSIR